jgi:hypothetical protein
MPDAGAHNAGAQQRDCVQALVSALLRLAATKSLQLGPQPCQLILSPPAPGRLFVGALLGLLPRLLGLLPRLLGLLQGKREIG